MQTKNHPYFRIVISSLVMISMVCSLFSTPKETVCDFSKDTIESNSVDSSISIPVLMGDNQTEKEQICPVEYPSERPCFDA